MPEPFLLSPHVVFVVLLCGNLQRHTLRDPDEAYAEVLGSVLAVPVEAAGPVLPDVVVQYLDVGIV